MSHLKGAEGASDFRRVAIHALRAWCYLLRIYSFKDNEFVTVVSATIIIYLSPVLITPIAIFSAMNLRELLTMYSNTQSCQKGTMEQ